MMSFSVNGIEIEVNKNLTEEGEKHVPKNVKYSQGKDVFSEPLMAMIPAIQNNIPIILCGQKGTGKTSCIRHLAEKTNNPLLFMQLTGSTDVDNFVGHLKLDQTGTYWTDGILTTAIKNGYWLLLDEVNMALPEIHAILHSVIEEPRMLTLDVKDKDQEQVIHVHPNFRLFCTMNPVDEYSGTKELNYAFEDRFVVLNTVAPTVEMEVDILLQKEHVKVSNEVVHSATDTTSNKGVLTRVCQYATSMRGLYSEQKFNLYVSPRNLIQWAVYMPYFGILNAYKIAIHNKIDQSDRVALDTSMDLVKSLFFEDEPVPLRDGGIKIFDGKTYSVPNLDIQDDTQDIVQDDIKDTDIDFDNEIR